MGDPSAVDTASVFNNFLEFTPIKLAFNESVWVPDPHTRGEQLYARGQSQEHTASARSSSASACVGVVLGDISSCPVLLQWPFASPPSSYSPDLALCNE